MYELIQVGAQSYYINCPAKIGVYRPDGEQVYLIDSGGDKDAGKKARQVLERSGWTLRGILNTHSHADHIGGNAYLQKQTGCRVFAGGMEAAFTRYPVLEPSVLYGGYPPAQLRHKFLMAQESEVTDFSDPAFPREVKIIPLPGHSLDMVGFRTPDGTVFLGDSLTSPQTLSKYAASFLWNVGAQLETLALIDGMEAPMFVPSHAEAGPDMRALTAVNRAHILAMCDRVETLCDQAMPFDLLLKRFFEQEGLVMTVEQHALVGSTLRSYLSYLTAQGRVEIRIEDNTLVWQRMAKGSPLQGDR